MVTFQFDSNVPDSDMFFRIFTLISIFYRWELRFLKHKLLYLLFIDYLNDNKKHDKQHWMKQKKKKSRKNLFVPWNNNINIIKFSEFFFFKIISYRTILFPKYLQTSKIFHRPNTIPVSNDSSCFHQPLPWNETKWKKKKRERKKERELPFTKRNHSEERFAARQEEEREKREGREAQFLKGPL